MRSEREFVHELSTLLSTVILLSEELFEADAPAVPKQQFSHDPSDLIQALRRVENLVKQRRSELMQAGNAAA